MLDKLLTNPVFSDLMQVHISEVIELLFEENIEFTILANIQKVSFDPPLPENIVKQCRPITPFSLANYTFKSARIDETALYFETGFGKENIGSYVSVDLSGILQIIVKDMPILINMSIQEEESIEEVEQEIEEESKSEGLDKSMNLFLSNPKNKNILK